MLRVIWFRYVIFRSLPAPLQYAARMAWYMQVNARNPRNRDRWLNQLARQWERLRNRKTDPVMNAAWGLITLGWQLCSDWPVLPPRSGEPLYGLKLARGGNPYVQPETLVFAWDVQADAKSVPVDRVYALLGLAHQTTDEQLTAWETCFWLAFYTEEAMGQAADRERHDKRR